ncbi:NAD-dependent epimerase/dehydratase family protein, partial [Glaesserella parasuis]|nr:NAD-dependent epimerase/dehydratase family protein [Glaesserella parasuis]
NIELTQKIAKFLQKNNKKTPLILSSSIQAERDNAYGRSKLAGEDIISNLSKLNGNPIYICRLANVFGKWSKPNYNSAVATFCYNTVHNLPIEIHDPNAVIRLVYIDDVVECFWNIIQGLYQPTGIYQVEPEYKVTVSELVEILASFKHSRQSLVTDEVGVGLKRALYSTYLSFFTPEHFDYSVPKYGDERGVFVEMLKTPSAGQFSYFTAYPGITRGGHYH